MFQETFNKILEKKYLILIIILIAFAVRLYGITPESIWLDEAFSIYHAQQSLDHIINLQDPNPPLHLIVLNLWTSLFGNSALSVRLPSLIFGVLSVYLIYLLGEKLFDRRTGIYSSIILALSTYHIFYSQEARVYSLLAFLSLLSIYFFVDVLKSKRKPHYIISTIFLLYAHFFALFFVLAQNIFFFYKNRDVKQLKTWIIIQLILFMAFIPGLLSLVNQINYVNEFFWIPQNFLIDVLWIPFVFSGGLLNLVYPLLFLFGIYTYRKNKNIHLLLILLLIPIIIPVLYSILLKPIFLTKYVIYTSIIFYVIIAAAITKLPERYRPLTIILIIIISIFNIGIQLNTIEKEPWNDVASYVESIRQEYDTIIIEPGYNILPFTYYYSDCFRSEDIYTCSADEEIFTIWGDEVDTYTEGTPRVIYITRSLSLEEYNSDYSNLLLNEFNLESSETFISYPRGNIRVDLLTSG